MVFFVPIMIGAVCRYIIPILFRFIPSGVDLELYVQMGVAVLILFPSLLTGMIAAFLMLDEKDEGTLLAIQVTPIPRTHYALYRLLSPVLMSVVLVIAMVLISELATVSVTALVFTALLASLSAPLWAFIIFLLSGNKIEGLAMVKLLNLFVGLPLLAEILPKSLIPVLWPLPLYWPYKFMVEVLRGANKAALVGIWSVGVFVHIFYLVLLLKYISRRTL